MCVHPFNPRANKVGVVYLAVRENVIFEKSTSIFPVDKN